MSAQAREGVDRASVLLTAIGDVGETVNQVHGMIRGQSASLAKNVFKLLTGVRAVVLSIKERAQQREDR